MAIKLASAVGSQREPIGILGGLDEAINKTGDAIQADQLRKSEAAAKKKDQEQRMKDAILGSLDVTTLEDVHPDDRAEDVNYKKEQFAKIAIASHDPNVTSSQLQQMHRDYIQGAKDREYLYKRDWEKARALEKARKEGYLTKDMDMFLAGQTEQQNTPTQISKSQENGGIGVPTQEEALGSTQFTGTPYFKKPIEERLKTNIDEEFDKRVVMPTLGALEAVKDINGKEFSPNDFVTRTVNKEGGWDYFVDKAKLENEAQKYAIHMTGNTNYGKRQNQTKTAMEKEAYMALRNAGLSDDEIVAEMPNVVKQLAYDDFMRKVQPAIDGELTRQKEEPLRREGKGITFNNNLGGGGIETPDGVFIPKETPLMSDEQFNQKWKQKNEEYYNNWLTKYDELNPKSAATDEEKLAMFKKEVDKPSANNPKLTINEWNKQQLKKESNNAKKGLTAISFTPKGKDNWFEATASDGKIRKIIPKTIYKNDKGELVKVEGYNVDESTGDIKIDLEEFEVDTKNEDNRNSFIGKYPTTIKSVGLNVPTKVVVSGKQEVGTIQGKGAKKTEYKQLKEYGGHTYGRNSATDEWKKIK